jgi:hypothetical protein
LRHDRLALGQQIVILDGNQGVPGLEPVTNLARDELDSARNLRR